MTYRIAGLNYADFAELFDLDDAALAERAAVRVIADADRGYPCRVSLQSARSGDELILLHHVSHDVATPYRSAYAIYVRKGAVAPPDYVDRLPPNLEGPPLGLRCFDERGMLLDARLAPPGEANAAIRAVLADARIAYIDAHHAAYGCFAARITRDDEVRR